MGLVLRELEMAGRAGDTLVAFSSDNGIPFPSGRTNLYEAGLRVPLLLASPAAGARRGQVSAALVSLLDLAPTALDWLGVARPDLASENEVFRPDTPRSLLPILEKGALSFQTGHNGGHSLVVIAERWLQSLRRRRTRRCSRRRLTTRSPCTTRCVPCARVATS